MYKNILRSEQVLKFNLAANNLIETAYSANTKQLLFGLLSTPSHSRLGMLHKGYEDIWQQAFFKGISGDRVVKKEMPMSPPINPNESSNGVHNSKVKKKTQKSLKKSAATAMPFSLSDDLDNIIVEDSSEDERNERDMLHDSPIATNRTTELAYRGTFDYSLY